MTEETEKLIKLISSVPDSDQAILTAFAILIEHLSQRESKTEASASRLLVVNQNAQPKQ